MEEFIKKITIFRDERDWKQFHNPKDLAISLSIEAAELLENFQWKSSELAVNEKSIEIEEELADVLIYSFLLADQLGLSVEEIVLSKLQKNSKKYPVEKSFGSSKKYTEL